MKPLSDRLLAMAASNMWSMQEVSDLLEEAAALAKSVESAPVGELFVSHHDARDFAIANDGNSLNLRYLAGQRVALVPLPQQSES